MNLTIISFVIALVGIVLQLVDAFPTHREARRTIAIMALGVFLGAAVSAASGAHYEISGNVDRQFALLYGLAAIAAAFAAVAVFVGDARRREAASAAGWVFMGAFGIVGFAVALGSSPAANQEISADELRILADQAERNGKYDVAVQRLKSLERHLASDQARTAIEKRVSHLELLQAGSISSK